jgi:expansin (peptidoglycan-binding protein)
VVAACPSGTSFSLDLSPRALARIEELNDIIVGIK